MAIVRRYRVRCTTESAWKYVWSENEPTACPDNVGHTIDAGLTTIVQSASTEQVNVLNDAGESVNWPMTTAKTPIYQPNIVPPGYIIYCTGAFDNITTGSRGTGNLIVLSKTGAGDAILEGRFLEHVYILGGGIDSDSADYADWISLEVFAPASAPAPTPGTGNANLVATGLGFNIVVPAPGNDGSHTVDGSVMENGEINQGLVPVPNSSGSGYWNWNPDATPSITPVTAPASPDGAYDLFDAELPLARQANRISLMFKGQLVPPTVKGKKILPHWAWRITLHRDDATGSSVAGALLTVARKKTT